MKYAIFGAGRVGVNIAAYLKHLGHDVSLISHDAARTQADACRRKISDADIVASAVPDGKIKAWRNQWAADIDGKIAIHFSGAADIDGMFAFHPLYSFPPHDVDSLLLKTVAFACPRGGPSFQEVFPGATNPHFEIHAHERARYHALAVLSGNFAAHLWNATAPAITKQSGLEPEAILGPYLQSVVDRFMESPKGSLTGPVARKDKDTVAANLKALETAPELKTLYDAFLRAAWPDYPS